MNNYLVVKRQKNLGCDKSIGCGVTVEFLSANSLEEVTNKAFNLPNDWRDEVKSQLDDCKSGLKEVDIIDDWKNELPSIDNYDSMLSSIKIYKIDGQGTEVIDNLRQVYKELDLMLHSSIDTRRQEETEKRELALYNKLKAKFENK